MKKLIIIITAIIAVANFGYAQESDTDFRNRLLAGLKTGLNYSNVYDSEGEDFVADSKLGFVGGVFLTIPLGEMIGIQPELLFSQKGFKGTGTLLGSPYSFTRTTNHIDVPLFFSVKPSRFVSILAGPQFSYILSQKDVFASSITSFQQEKEFNNDNPRKNMLGFTGGMDFNFKHLIVGARAGLDLQNNHGDGTSSTPRYKNSWYQLTLGYKIYN